MLIQCPNCDTKYNLNEAAIGPGGSKVRCIRCDHVFFVAPPGADSSQSSQGQGQARKTGLDQELKEDFDWLDEVEQEDNSGIKRGKDGYSIEIQASEEPKNRTMTYVVVGLVVAIILMASFLYVQRTLGPVSSWFGGSSESEMVAEPKVLGPDDVHLISLQNVRQYFVSNEKIGQLFVIEGKARNDFPEPMELFRIEASLFDAAGQVVERNEFLAGNSVSLFQLQILSEQELEAALSARVGILTNNTNIRPGMDVQFMVVFSNPPDTVQEYGLKVIGAQHPPR
ncbi:DUF3426 domain-containing protein [Desulfonatronum sp. SC1]|uniref:DUF3426 domain-containing protein n=1 Tax=Desulfonatronum sp. SC1 TaxID=2109626 RepID=UPI000D325526|nr:DUF3426 domain-containing protein [Desulfonatronum sp. SC1]PTN38334.1 hypothetical protein C6366_03225 [Desulfonatronum sp. SC1]